MVSVMVMWTSLAIWIASTLLLGTCHALSSIVPPAGLSQSPTSTLFASHFHKTRSELGPNELFLTHLEVNGFLLSTADRTILIDPLLEGPLDFGLSSSIYQGSKRVLPAFGLTECLPARIDCLLLTQGLDDHAHFPTLQALKAKFPMILVMAPPSARSSLQKAGFVGNNVRYIRPGQESKIFPDSYADSRLTIRATSGALVGPPWQARENGYLIKGSNCPSIYIEPHVEFQKRALEHLAPVDVVLSPISGQGLPGFELVHGPKETLKLCHLLKPRCLVPIDNGNLHTSGALSPFIEEIGSAREFQKLLQDSGLDTKLVEISPGKDVRVTV
jgi:L-ascorbate metabolism protein UlaG (beta-lactamase superfamily)